MGSKSKYFLKGVRKENGFNPVKERKLLEVAYVRRSCGCTYAKERKSPKQILTGRLKIQSDVKEAKATFPSSS
ncbi:hypothetical protein OQ252_10980 [Acetobacter farinalis]|uniref:Transposase n=1 Tax=Acetobacter farinalis TaxID=1260984 RepID=A0ABT3Q9H6_9PROT|nr:hypothetical protein [Acetobacter farinalis]MCX2561914.1 hypothetical protein [Acetobacter farinalis]NHO30493.1 hypothetical protein [Acetobacter farinalis]